MNIADDFLKNDGRKFLNLMERLAERKLRQIDEEAASEEWDEEYENDSAEFDEDEEVSLLVKIDTLIVSRNSIRTTSAWRKEDGCSRSSRRKCSSSVSW